MSLYRLDTSIRVQGSHSRAIADIVEQEWRRARPGDPVIRHHVGVDPIPATALGDRRICRPHGVATMALVGEIFCCTGSRR